MSKKILCHCEDVEVEEIYSALEQGFGDLETLRRYTGIGTGKCQGKCCLVQTLRILASVARLPAEEDKPLTGDPRRIRLPTIRPPVLPLRIGEIAEADEDNGAHGGASESEEKAR